jgi:hypothetical protein
MTSSAGNTALLQNAHNGAETVDRHCVGLYGLCSSHVEDTKLALFVAMF